MRISFFWAFFGLLMGIALGGSFVSMYSLNSTRYEVTATPQQHGTPEATKSKKDETDEALANYTLWLTGFTGVLAVATIGLGIATFGLYLTGEKQIKVALRAGGRQHRAALESNKITRQAADAATRSAKAAIGMKLPIVRCDVPVVWGMNDPLDGGGVGVSSLISYNFHKVTDLAFRNKGETPFFPYEVALAWLVTERPAVEPEKLPVEPNYTDIHPISGEKVIAEFFAFRTPTFALRTSDAVFKNDLNSGQKSVRVLARIKYRDFLEEDHEARFCWIWTGGNRKRGQHPGLIPDDLAPKSYTRKT